MARKESISVHSSIGTSWECSSAPGLSCGPRASKIPAGLCTFSTSMWKHAGEASPPPACLVFSSLQQFPRALCLAPAVGCNFSFRKILGNLSCNCSKCQLPFGIRVEPRLCHTSRHASAPLNQPSSSAATRKFPSIAKVEKCSHNTVA